MRRAPFGFLSSTTSIITAILTIAGISGVAYAGGSELFAPGNLSAKSGAVLGGVTSHSAIQECGACHAPPWNGERMADRCLACHIDVSAELQDAQSLHSLVRFAEPDLNCRACHTEHHGPNASLTQMPPGWNPHDQLGFSLKAHRLRLDGELFACRDCHVLDYALPFDQTVCADCHFQVDLAFTQEHILTFWLDCIACHDGVDTYGRSFDHTKTPFALVGLHTIASCSGCHPDARHLNDLRAAPQDCYSCHQKDDPHGGSFGLDCGACHTPEGWAQSAQFDHNLSAFKLTGKHVNVACGECHKNRVYKGTPSDCYSCHAAKDKHNGEFGTDCAACHTPDGWDRAVDHSQFAFKLEGKHAVVECAACHAGGVFKGTPSDCVACHLKNDAHAGRLGTQCGACHTPNGWKPASFDHNTVRFALTAHQTRSDGAPFACADCHAAGYAQPFNQNVCANCHLNDNPAFMQEHILTFWTDCMACHDGVDSHGASFDHNTVSFPLSGKHAQVKCGGCHVNDRNLNDLKSTPQTCYACHQKDDFHQGTLGTDCAACHTPSGWKPSTFDHNRSVFKLSGKHAGVSCSSCHQNGVFKGTPQDCFSCHAKNDRHMGAFGTNCAACHTPEGWGLAQVDHSKFAFPLTGKHTAVACEACHAGGVFKGTPTVCSACHNAQDPHGGALGSDCASCHTTNGWTPSAFDHSRSIFQLTGAHVSVSCSQCHTDKRFKGTPTSCSACHSKNDPHGGQFGSNCNACHTTTAWKPATFDHSRSAFPLTGKHTSVNCASCHVNGVYAGTPKDCYSCHAKNDKHGGRYGTNCAACHSASGWKPATFDHNRSAFPLTGAHASLSCSRCHANGVYKGTPTACVACHADPAFHAGAFGTQCQSCHNTSSWKPAIFNLSHPQPAVNEHGSGIHHGGASCRTCHPSTVHTYTCLACHSDNQGGEGGDEEEDD